MNISNILDDFGFDDKGSKVYLYLLEKKDIPVFQVAKDTDIPRTTVYTILERLKHQGFASIFKMNGIAYWNAESPRRLVNAAEEKSKRIKEILPDLESMFNSHDSSPNVKFYTGKEKMKEVILNMYDYLHQRGIHEICTISHPELFENFPKLLPDFIKQREKLNIRTKLISHQIARTNTPETYKSNDFRETRFLPEGFHFNCTMMIGGNMAAFLSFKDGTPYSVTIESPTIVNLFMQVYLFAWKMLEKKEESI